MLHLTIVMASGRSESLSIPQSSKVGDLAILAGKSLQHGFLRLVTAGGHVLGDSTESLQKAGIQDGDYLTAVQLQAKLTANKVAFALWCWGGDRIITWGDPECGGDSSTVSSNLRSVQHVQGSAYAFAAVLADGSVATWGNSDYGGDSSAVQDQLQNVQRVEATDTAFAAMLACLALAVLHLELCTSNRHR